MRAALGVANIWLSDTRRSENVARLDIGERGFARLVLEYGDDSRDLPATSDAIARTRAALGVLGCVAPGSMVKILPRGSSVHYAGTIPMGGSEDEHTTRADGMVRGFDGLYVADGAGFPWLPAKNITFTLMANATRIASELE
jgi:choline dehydrogenase-like flavoprotein